MHIPTQSSGAVDYSTTAVELSCRRLRDTLECLAWLVSGQLNRQLRIIMAKFMPSEIARLVFGYLRDTGCQQSMQAFLQESRYLTEFADGWRQGIEYSTRINGRSLVEILNSRDPPSEQATPSQAVVPRATPIQLSNNVVSNVNSSAGSANQTTSYSLTDLPLNQPPILMPFTSNVFNPIPMVVVSGCSSLVTATTTSLNPTHSGSTVVVNASQEKSSHGLRQELVQESDLFKTPRKHDHYDDGRSPRRKGLPRRRLVGTPERGQGQVTTPFKSPFKSPMSASSSSAFDDGSSPIPNSASSKVSAGDLVIVGEPMIQPELIVEELVKFQPIHETIANRINRFIEHKEDSNDKNDSQLTLTPDDLELTSFNDIQIQSLIDELEHQPEYELVLKNIHDKEMTLFTPFKSVSPLSTTTSQSAASSLNTPVPKRTVADLHNNDKVVKNLMGDLRTPEKSSPHSASDFGSSMATVKRARLVNETSSQQLVAVSVANSATLRVTPKKTGNNSMANRTIILSPNHVAKNSLADTSPAVVATSLATKEVMMLRINQPVQLQSIRQIANLTSNGSKREVKGKRVDFCKPASELQFKKILPKTPKTPASASPTTPITSTNTTTTVIPAMEAEPNKESNLDMRTERFNAVFQGNRKKRVMRTADVMITQQTGVDNSKGGQLKKDDGNSSKKKYRATQPRLPVNLLKKMSSNEMNKFLDKIHPNQR